MVRDARGRALYFSRSAIPYPREAEKAAEEEEAEDEASEAPVITEAERAEVREVVVGGRRARMDLRVAAAPDAEGPGPRADELDELVRIREQGYALDREEITRGLMCVAAPIYDVHGEIAGAISCTFQSYINADRVDMELERAVGRVVRAFDPCIACATH